MSQDQNAIEMNIADYIRRKKLSHDGDTESEKPSKTNLSQLSQVDIASSQLSMAEDLAKGNLSSLADWRAL